MDGTEAAGRMARRMGVVLAACALVPALAFALLGARVLAGSASQSIERRLNGISQTQALELASRLSAAETIAHAFTVADVGAEGATLRQQLVDSRAFKSIVLADRDGLLASGETRLRPLPSQLLALETGQTVLVPVTLSGQLPSVFLARAVRAGGAERLAYFELAPAWLWRDLRNDAPDVATVVVDAEGRILQSARALPADTGPMFARLVDRTGERAGTRRSLGWQAEGSEWRGVLAHVPLANGHITAVPWAVVAYTQERGFLASSAPIWQLLPAVLIAGLGAALLALWYLARCHVVPLRRLGEVLRALPARRSLRGAALGCDEPRALLEEAARAAASLEDQFRALEIVGEIDKLLLASAELEQVLDAVLSRVQAVTRCHSAGITLRDADAPGRGRVYVAAAALKDLPVSRVALDEDMLATLAAEPAGLTVARCEATRHSFLWPLKDLGAEFFWLWPVTVAERIEAILAVGYREPPIADPHVAGYGAEFAGRLAFALSRNARDEQLYRQAHYDPLTALPNRLLFRDRLAQELANATAGRSRGALLYIDLDHFKRVNDSVGHVAGDQLLSIVGQRLRACVKEGDTVARLGGDEFTVILRNVTDPDAARAVAGRVIESLQMPVNIGGRDQYVTASIGITLFPDDGASIDELMRNADTAMYRAKDLGRGCTTFYDRRMALAPAAPTDTGLHRALRRREFTLYYQPQFSVATGALAGLEALLRWQTPHDGLRCPGEFVPAAEQSGLIVDIGGWVLEAACAQLAAWREQGIAPPRLALNVSAQQLCQSEFPQAVRRALDGHGLPPHALELELTEGAFADEAAGAALVRLAKLGVQLALDDFGTGYSSLSYLRQHPLGTVKIDRSFLEEVPQNPAAATLVETIIVMAHTLGKRVVAEGIETLEQLEFLRERRCDCAQGFYLARPLTAQAVTEMLQGRRIDGRSGGDVRAAG